MTQSPELPENLLNQIPWNSENEAIWMATSLLLRRNLARFNFPSKFHTEDAKQVFTTLIKSILTQIENPFQRGLSQLSSSHRELLFEHFLIAKAYEEPPNESALIYDESKELLFFVNGSNHLEMRTISTSPNWDEKWKTLAHMEDAISKSTGFAFSPKFGYLTADPATCGTGLTVQAYLHLPALIHTNQLQSALASIEDDELLFMGISGSLEDLIGDLIIVENNYTLGMSEEAILHSIQNAVTKLVGAEKTLRSHLKDEENSEIKDLISKAYGLTLHAYQIETKEALDLLSLMKLGLSLEYISGISDEKLSNLYFKCRRGHLSTLFPDFEEIAQKRADFLQEELKGISLKE